MQLILNTVTVAAGLLFSTAVAILAEEMIFGQVFRLFLAPQAVKRFRNRQESLGR